MSNGITSRYLKWRLAAFRRVAGHAIGLSSLDIVSIGAGSIVHDAHLPAYRRAGFPVAATQDVVGSAPVAVLDARA